MRFCAILLVSLAVIANAAPARNAIQADDVSELQASPSMGPTTKENPFKGKACEAWPTTKVFDAGYGYCNTYAKGQGNHNFCAMDAMDGKTAGQVCKECGCTGKGAPSPATQAYPTPTPEPAAAPTPTPEPTPATAPPSASKPSTLIWLNVASGEAEVSEKTQPCYAACKTDPTDCAIADKMIDGCAKPCQNPTDLKEIVIPTVKEHLGHCDALKSKLAAMLKKLSPSTTPAPKL